MDKTECNACAWIESNAIREAHQGTIYADQYALIIVYLAGSGCPDVIPTLTSTHGKPVLTERTFQQLLAAACILQRHHDRLYMKEHVADHVALYSEAIAENARPFQTVALRLQPVQEPEDILPLKPVLAAAHGDVEFLAPQRDSVIPPETARNLSVLASRLQSLLPREIRTSFAWAPVVPVASAQEAPGQTQRAVVEDMSGQSQPAVAEDMPAQGESAVARDAGSETSGFESAVVEVVKDQAADSTCASEPDEYFPARTVGNRMSQSNQSFWGTATAIAASAVLCLLLVASAHRLSPLPGGLSRPPDLIQQQVPFQQTEPSTAVEATRQKPIATPARLYSPDSSDANVVARDPVPGRDTRSLASRLQTQKKPPGKLPATKVIPAQKTGVKPSRLISTSGRNVDVAAEDTLLRYDARNFAPGVQGQKK